MIIDKVNRRLFLQGSGGVVLAVPFLSSLVSKTLQASVNNGLEYIVAIRCPYGAYDTQYFPQPGSINPIYSNASENVKIWNMSQVIGTSPIFNGTTLKDIASKVSMYQGLDRFGWIGHDGEEFLTGIRATSGHYSQSIDQIISKKIYANEPFTRNLNLGATSGRLDISFYVDSKGNRQRAVTHPYGASAIEFIFSNIGATPAQTAAIKNSNLSIISAVLSEYNQLKNSSKLSKNDINRLTHHMDLLSDFENQLRTKNTPNCERPDDSEFTGGTGLERTRDLLKVAKTAIVCGLTNVVTLTISADHLHGPSHSNKGDATTEQSKATHTSVMTPIMSEIATFCNDLNSITDSNGVSKLDKGMVLIGSDMGSTINHCPNSYPITVVGGKNVVNSGKFIDYRNPVASPWGRGRPGQPYNRFLMSVMKAMGLNQNDWEIPETPGFGSHVYSPHDRHYWDNFFTNYDKRALLPHFFA